MSQQRDQFGRFVPGNSGGPGRPTKARELAYWLVAQEVVSLEDWRKIIDLNKQLAFWGDKDARNFIANHLIGRPGTRVRREEVDPELQNWLENASDEELRAVLAENRAKGIGDHDRAEGMTAKEMHALIAHQDAKEAAARQSNTKPRKRRTTPAPDEE